MELKPGGTGGQVVTQQPARPGSAGATEKPQFPTTSVVTPCRILLSAFGLSGNVKSECV